MFEMRLSYKVLFSFLLLLVCLRTGILGLEIILRPLFPWDATMHWATKARVWFEFRDMVPFTDQWTWQNTFGEGVYHDRHPNYPFTIPLLQVWMNLAINSWNESIMNLPWIACYIALGGAFYAQLRNAGVNPGFSMAFTYFLLSMPLINTHVALAGYADLFIGALFCGAVMAFHNWTTTRDRWQALLALIFAIACVRVKMEGALWALCLVPALLVTNATSTRKALALLAGLGALGIVTYVGLRQFFPGSLHPLLFHITPFSVDGLLGLVKSGWLHNNSHLFTYLLPASVALALFLPPAVLRTYRGIATALAAAITVFFFLFLFTVFSQGAVNFTGVGRLSIQLAPSLLFFCALLCHEIYYRGITLPGPLARFDNKAST